MNADDSQYEPQNANELIKLENGVQLFFVADDGKVSTFSDQICGNLLGI